MDGWQTGSLWDRSPKSLRWLMVIAAVLYFGGGLLAGTIALLRI